VLYIEFLPTLLSSQFSPSNYLFTSYPPFNALLLTPQTPNPKTSRGPLAAAYNKLEQLQKCNNRIERALAAISTTHDNQDLHKKLETDRHQSLKLCLDVKELLEQCPQNQQRTQLTNELKTEMSRLESLSQELKSKDLALNKATVRSSEKTTKTTQNDNKRNANKRPQHKPAQQGEYDPLLQDDDDNTTQLMEQQIVKDLLLTEEQEQSIDIDQMQRRKEEILQIESDVQKLAIMFQDLQQMVYEQGEQLDIIEETIGVTQTNTENAYVALEQAEEHQIASSKSLKYLFCAGLIALIAVVVVAVILYTKRNKA
jgi:t-SNARE complex subunit (syntaxin)